MENKMQQLIEEFNKQQALWTQASAAQHMARNAIIEVMQKIGRELSGLKEGDIIRMSEGTRYEIHGISAKEVPDNGRMIWVVSLSGYRISKAGKKIGKALHGIYGKWEKEIDTPPGSLT